MRTVLASALVAAGLSAAASAQSFDDTATVNALIEIENLDAIDLVVERNLDFGTFGYILTTQGTDGYYGWTSTDVSLTKTGTTFTCSNPAADALAVTIRPNATTPTTGFLTASGTANRSALIAMSLSNGTLINPNEPVMCSSTGSNCGANRRVPVRAFGFHLYGGSGVGSTSTILTPLTNSPHATSFDDDGQLAMCFFGEATLSTDLVDSSYLAQISVTVAYD